MTLIIAAHTLDLLTFYVAASLLPIEGEGNPLARAIYLAWGLPGVTLLKIAGISLSLAVLSGIPDSPIKGFAVGFIAFLGLFGAVTNTLAVVVTR